MTFTLTFVLGQSIRPKETVSGCTAGAGAAGGGVLAVGRGVFAGGVGLVEAVGDAVRDGEGLAEGLAVLVCAGEAVRVGEDVAGGLEEAAGGVAVGSVVEEASEVLFPPVKAGITISAPITKKIAAMITLTGCIPAPPENIA